jgi:hypothetical protein
MADTRPTPVSFAKAVRLSLLLLFSTEKFIAEEKADNEAHNNRNDKAEREHSARTVRRAFTYGFLLVLAFAAIGYGFGALLGYWLGYFPAKVVAWMQVVGACLLLWGTLFVRGWEIETYCGVTYTERVNQWLYRFLYCIGTAMIVCSLALPQCAV